MRSEKLRVVVTGGSSGIGAAIVNRFIQEGAQVCVLDIVAPSYSVEFFIPCDVSQRESVCSAFAEIARRWEEIDVVCNNAGISVREPFGEIRWENWNRTLGVNLSGPFLVSQQAVPLMKGGCIINIASVSGMVGMPNYLSYNVSKAGLIELTKTLALELAPKIRVNAICPGYVLTSMQEKEYTQEAMAACAAKIPLKRLGKPSEIAALALYLASSESAYMTGHCVVIDGGETAGGLASA